MFAGSAVYAGAAEGAVEGDVGRGEVGGYFACSEACGEDSVRWMA